MAGQRPDAAVGHRGDVEGFGGRWSGDTLPMDRVALAALVGCLLGLGLGLDTNVSGVVLALYGLALGALLGAVVAVRRGDRHGRR